MENYEAICASNRDLFEKLELLTTQISFCNAKHNTSDIAILQYKKENIRKLIDSNLDKLEVLWKRDGQVKASILEMRIIKSFRNNPDQTENKIATDHDCSYGTVRVILTKYLNKQYIGL